MIQDRHIHHLCFILSGIRWENKDLVTLIQQLKDLSKTEAVRKGREKIVLVPSLQTIDPDFGEAEREYGVE
jgi:hypothetical protein